MLSLAEQINGTHFGVRCFIRYDQVVEAIGGYAEYVEDPNDVSPAVARAIASQRPSLVNVAVRPGASPLADAMIARRTGGGSR